MKYVFDRTITEQYEVEAVDQGHAEEILGNLQNSLDLTQHLIYSMTSGFNLIGTKISQGNIMPKPKSNKRTTGNR